jgi:hypothetical protein
MVVCEDQQGVGRDADSIGDGDAGSGEDKLPLGKPTSRRPSSLILFPGSEGTRELSSLSTSSITSISIPPRKICNYPETRLSLQSRQSRRSPAPAPSKRTPLARPTTATAPSLARASAPAPAPPSPVFAYTPATHSHHLNPRQQDEQG